MSDLDFNFLTEPLPTKEPEVFVGPNIKDAVKMTPKKFATSILDVYEKLGGASWLWVEAKADPKAFMDLLKRLIPKSVQLDDLGAMEIRLIDQFGNEIQIQAHGGTDEPATTPRQMESGQLQIATGGSPLDDKAPISQEEKPSSDSPSSTNREADSIEIKDVFS